MANRIKLLSFLLVVSIFAACGKNDSSNAATKNLPGTIYWTFAGDVGYYDLKANKYVKKMMLMGGSPSRFDNYDISWDNQKILLSMDVEGTFNFDERRIVIRNKADNITYEQVNSGGNIADFDIEWGGITAVNGRISPNEKYVAINAQHFSDLPLTIVGVDEKTILATWEVRGVSFLDYGAPIWTSDNTVYFRIGTGFYKSSITDNFQTGQKILELGTGVSHVVINPQGTKIVYRKDKHLWLANIDGTGPQQITASQTMDFISYDGELRPVFSPDGNYIAFTGASKRGTPWSDHDYPDGSWVATTGGSYGYIIIVPADGKQYNLEDNNSGAIWLREAGNSGNAIPCSGTIIWR